MSKVLPLVLEKFAKKRLDAQLRAQSVASEIYKKTPRIGEIESRLSQIGMNMSMFAIENPENCDDFLDMLRAEILSLQLERRSLLKIEGYGTDALEPDYECKICEDRGYVGNVRCGCLKRAINKEEYVNSNIGGFVEDQTFEKFDLNYYSKSPINESGLSAYNNMNMILGECKTFVHNFKCDRRSLLFMGGAGLGKTFLSSAIAKEIVDIGYSVYYQRAFDIFNLYEDYKFGRVEASSAQATINLYYNVDLLIIDDLGSEITNKNTVGLLFNIVDRRITEGKKTMISTNLNLKELTEVYSARFTSRIFENYSCLNFIGNDIRLQKMGL